MTKALVLAGHGSHISPLTAGIVWQQVDRLRALGVADEVTAAFWKETPSFATVLNTLVAEDITIVPLFTAQGYFTRSVIPAEMGLEVMLVNAEPLSLSPFPRIQGKGGKSQIECHETDSPTATVNGQITTRAGRTIRYARTLGEHPFLQQMIHKRVVDMLQLINTAPQNVGVALIGHGTKRNPQSRAATEAQVAMLRAEKLVAEAVAVYLDDTPAIPEVYTMLHTPIIIAVPNFLALGSHTTIDVPEALGLKAGETRDIVDGRVVYYTDPVGVDDNLSAVILALARDAGAQLNPPKSGSAWDGFPAAGRDELIETVHQQGELRFGQLILTPTEVRADGDGSMFFREVSTLRDHVRTIPAFRPLATSTDLPGGWCVPISEPHMLHAIVETVYPGAVADWAAQRRGVLTTNPLTVVAARQKGMFRDLANFRRTDEYVRHICGGCVRHATWYDQVTAADAIPCVEACNLWMSKALETDE